MDSIKNIRYPGRFILLGKDGDDFVAIYGVTGRSASSLARRYIRKGNEILAIQTEEGGNAELLTYPAFYFLRNGIVVANGRQIQNISVLNKLTAKEQLSTDLVNEEYEPDDNKTPRITGCYIENNSDTTAGLHIVHSINGASERETWDIPLVSGKGSFISTYAGEDTKIAPSFEGEPVTVNLSFGSCDKAAQAIFDLFAPKNGEADYRVSVIACYKKLGEEPRVSILNKLNS